MIYNINDKLQMKHDKSIKFTITGVYEGLYSMSLGHDYFDYELDMYCEKATNEEMEKMKEMYLKGYYFCKALDMCCEDDYYGTFGEITDMTYKDGSPLHTGDIVKLLYKDGSIIGHRIVTHNKDEYGVLGVFSSKFINGKADDWRIKLVCKYYNNNKDKVGDIIIVDKDQFIQLEGGKNLTIDKIAVNGEKYIKVNDDFINIKNIKKVFTIDEDCEIEYEDYEVFSTSSLFNEDRLTIIRKNGIEIVRLVKPTSDKVRHEFAYYGIDVEVK